MVLGAGVLLTNFNNPNYRCGVCELSGVSVVGELKLVSYCIFRTRIFVYGGGAVSASVN